jgi:hypothetical protein
MVDNIIQLVREKLSSLSYIEGIVLGGSRARGLRKHHCKCWKMEQQQQQNI